MTAEERIITAVDAHSGEYVDGSDFDALLERTLKSGTLINELYGDKAYFRKNILEKIDGIGADSYIPVSASAYKIDEELFSYNKDSDQWFCFMGNKTVSKKFQTKKKSDGGARDLYSYKFDKEQCKGCMHRQECMGSQKNKARAAVNLKRIGNILIKNEKDRIKPLFYLLSGKHTEILFRTGLPRFKGEYCL